MVASSSVNIPTATTAPTATPVSTQVISPMQTPASISTAPVIASASPPVDNLKDQIINKIAALRDHLTGSRAIIILVVVYAIIMVAYFLSETYRVESVYSELDKYRDYLVIDGKYLNTSERKHMKLKEFYVASSFRPYMAKNQLLDYCSKKLLQKVIISGARFLYIDIFNSNLSENSRPVISSGYENGNWKLTLNTIDFEEFCRVISVTAFSSGYVNNYNDPLILALNLKTNHNFITLNRIQETLIKYFKPRLLSSKYSNQKVNMADVEMRHLMGKIIIMTSGGYEDSTLEELINMSWDKDVLNKIPYNALGDPEQSNADDTTEVLRLNFADIKDENTKNLTIVTPSENSFFTFNYPPEYYFRSGCQFICMNYQKVDKNMSEYISKFKTSSFVEKPTNL